MPLKCFGKYSVITITILLILVIVKCCYFRLVQPHPALVNLPKNFLWAWQRPEDLRFLTDNTGVAYVVSSITLEASQTYVYPRMHPLLVNSSAILMPVVHVDASLRKPPNLTEEQAEAIVNELIHAETLSGSHVVQLDFEVRRSQREFFIKVVHKARQSLPKTTALSVTALASWCVGNSWLEALPVDEIVPMAFRMAAGNVAIRGLLVKQGHFEPAICRKAIGTAIDEPSITLDSANIRRYYFSPKSWTHALWQQQKVLK